MTERGQPTEQAVSLLFALERALRAWEKHRTTIQQFNDARRSRSHRARNQILLRVE
jgi:hypothetical protein